MRFSYIALFLTTSHCWADVLPICYDYGCQVADYFEITSENIQQIEMLFIPVQTPLQEKEAVSKAIGYIEKIAGEQTPTYHDKGENHNDDGVEGRMDCIDESNNTYTYLRWIEKQKWFRFHRTGSLINRYRFFISPHWAVELNELNKEKKYVVDSWYFNNGEPAVIMNISQWLHSQTPANPGVQPE